MNFIRQKKIILSIVCGLFLQPSASFGVIPTKKNYKKIEINEINKSFLQRTKKSSLELFCFIKTVLQSYFYGEKVNKNVLCNIPDELFYEIFEYISLTNLEKIRIVGKKLNKKVDQYFSKKRESNLTFIIPIEEIFFKEKVCFERGMKVLNELKSNHLGRGCNVCLSFCIKIRDLSNFSSHVNWNKKVWRKTDIKMATELEKIISVLNSIRKEVVLHYEELNCNQQAYLYVNKEILEKKLLILFKKGVNFFGPMKLLVLMPAGGIFALVLACSLGFCYLKSRYLNSFFEGYDSYQQLEKGPLINIAFYHEGLEEAFTKE